MGKADKVWPSMNPLSALIAVQLTYLLLICCVACVSFNGPSWLLNWTTAQLQQKHITAQQGHARLASFEKLASLHQLYAVNTNISRSSFGRRQPSVFHSRRAKGSPTARTNAVCMQAWTGSGTGAWYRVDSACESSRYASTSLQVCFPEHISIQQPNREGAYISLGIFSAKTGHGSDIGLVYSPDTNMWSTYAGDEEAGWLSGSNIINPKQYPCIDMTAFVLPDGQGPQSVGLAIADAKTGKLINQVDVFKGLDRNINITKTGLDLGWYRFASIAQNAPEQFNSGSVMYKMRDANWQFYFANGTSVPATKARVSYDVRGYKPGPCCSQDEIRTITVQEESQWTGATKTIQYTSSSERHQ